MKKLLLRAFSLVELMVTLVIISVVMSALVPAITKKLKSQGITAGGSIGGGGGSGGGGASSDYDPNLTMDCEDNFGANCELCYTNACITCSLVCSANEYKDVGTCSCITCADRYGTQCLDCDTNSCTECESGYGTTSGGGCELCDNGQYSDGSKKCQNCPAGYYCVNAEKIICPTRTYSDTKATSCFSCSEITLDCAACTVDTCTKCNPGYTLSNNRCNFAMEEKEFTSAGKYEFVIPDDVTKVKAIAVSGGAGGGGGKVTTMTTDFLTAGTHTWTIPVAVQGASIVFSSVGGGGGAGSGWGAMGSSSSRFGARGNGYGLKDISLELPASKTELSIIIGATGSGRCGCRTFGEDGWCSGKAGGSTYIEGYYNNTELVAKGGTGASAKWLDAVAGCTGYGTGATGNNIFETSNIGISRGHGGESGAMRIYWNDKTPATGGGTGHIAYNEEISVIPGETLTVIVGRGGKGGEASSQGEWGSSEMISKIIGSSGTVYMTSAVSPSTMGSTGGNPDGTTLGSAGYITDGQTSAQITVDGLSGSDGFAINDLAGGNGGQTIINGVMTHCVVGVGGSGIDVDGTNATGYGGCGGGGAGAGAKGGAGAVGYVKIELIK